MGNGTNWNQYKRIGRCGKINPQTASSSGDFSFIFLDYFAIMTPEPFHIFVNQIFKTV